MNPYAPPTAPIGQDTFAQSISAERAEELRRQIKKYNSLSFALGLPGILLQIVGRTMADGLGTLLVLVGAALFVAGLWFYTKMRGQHPALCLLGLVSCLGMLILYFLPKKCLNCTTAASYSAKQCGACGAPLGS
jgi:hypothetical protein